MSPFSSSAPGPAWRGHVCGLYYNASNNGYFLQKTYLPQVELHAHATILATTSRTILTQTFVNPLTEKGIREVRYTFPLYDGVSVVGFTCHVGDRTIIGEVKEKEKSRAVFQEAVERGETAGLLEQLPDAADVFTTTVGNVPPGVRVIINITYLGELKHDMEVNGIRFTIPNIICPRYGNYPGTLRTTPAVDAMGGGISIIVDVEMPEGSLIQKIQSPTHPISMAVGTTSFAPNAEPTMTKASATLALGTAQLETDLVLQVIAKDTGIPKAILEKHPTIPNQQALMATLVPKLALPAEKPEVVFVCDRSGSMEDNRINLVVQALKVFLKSLPVGVKFNICSFGSSHTFLWPKSVTYSQQTLDEATRHADTFSANYGGTEMLYPLKATIEKRYKDMSLEVILLTDGEIWDQQALFSYLNTSISEPKAAIRIFTLGIGDGVSHSLIEGVARAGNGFSQTVGDDEKLGGKVVRMLKGALSPHINDYTLEVKYSNNITSDQDEEFEIIEKVTDSLKVKLDLGEKQESSELVGFPPKTMSTFFIDYNQKKPISLFDDSVDPDKEEPLSNDETGEERYAHLPKIPVPRVLQAPQNIPSLFAFNRTTAYLLLGPNSPQATPKSVVLRGTSAHGPLELEIPIQVLELPGETIHQLAAKKAISELEQGRGWLPEAKDESGTLIKSKLEGRFDDMVECEAVRLGVQFQVGGKWCSFVAVESNQKKAEDEGKVPQGWEWLEDEGQMNAEGLAKFTSTSSPMDSPGMQQQAQHISPSFGPVAPMPASTALRFASMPSGPPQTTSPFGTPAPPVSTTAGFCCTRAPPDAHPSSPAHPVGALTNDDKNLDLTMSGTDASILHEFDFDSFLEDTADGQPGGFSAGFDSQTESEEFGIAAASPLPDPPVHKTPEQLLHYLIALQTFAGSWNLTPTLIHSLKSTSIHIDEALVSREISAGVDRAHLATAIVIVVFEEKLAEFKGSWELVVEKAREWLEGEISGEEKDGEGFVERVRRLVS